MTHGTQRHVTLQLHAQRHTGSIRFAQHMAAALWCSVLPQATTEPKTSCPLSRKCVAPGCQATQCHGCAPITPYFTKSAICMPNGPSVWPNRCEFYRTKDIKDSRVRVCHFQAHGFIYVLLIQVFLCCYTVTVHVLLLCSKTAAYQRFKHTKRTSKMSNRCFYQISLTSTCDNHSCFFFLFFFYSLTQHI